MGVTGEVREDRSQLPPPQIYHLANDHRCRRRGVMPIFKDAHRRRDPVVCDIIEKEVATGGTRVGFTDPLTRLEFRSTALESVL